MRFEYTLDWDGRGRWRPTAAIIDLETASPNDYVAKYLRVQGEFYERVLLEHIALRGPRGGLFVDVGANIGNHSVYFARFLADCVVAVEPSPQLIPVLTRNLETNGITNALVIPRGAAARSPLPPAPSP